MKITVVGCPSGDWEGLFVNGQLVFEGHSISWWQALDALKIEYETLEADDEWMMDHGSFPNRLSKVKLAVD
jgi:hypothetical protein